MRRDKLDRAGKKIKWVTPKWFFKRCTECDDDVKNEQMWTFQKYYSAGMHSCSMRIYTCFKCCPTLADCIEAHPSVFKDVDVTPLREEYDAMRQHNIDGKKPPFDTDPQNRQSI